MRLLIVSQHFYPEPFRINDMAFSLAKRGHTITVLTGLPNYPSGIIDPDYRNHKKHNEVLNGVTIHRTGIIGRGKSLLRMGLNYLSFAVNGSLRAVFLNETFDAILVFQTSPVSMILPGIIVKHKQHIPLFVYCLDQWPISVTTGPISDKSLIYTFLFTLSQWHYRQANQILLSSQSFEHYFEKVLQLNKNQYGLHYWPTYAEDVYGEVGSLDNSTFDVVFAGNVGPAQSVETLVEAALHLSDTPSIQFHIVGDGLNLKACQEMADKAQLKNIHFYGHHPVDKMKQFYTLADAFLITMVDNSVVNSTLPAKLQSYMRAGKPIIGAINGEVKRVVEEAQCGWICPALDAKALAKLIKEASYSKNLIQNYGQNGLNYYYTHFDKEKQLDKLMERLEKAL